MDEGGSHRRVYRASNISKEPIVPSPSTMPLYDPKGTRWASYTTATGLRARAAAFICLVRGASSSRLGKAWQGIASQHLRSMRAGNRVWRAGGTDMLDMHTSQAGLFIYTSA